MPKHARDIRCSCSRCKARSGSDRPHGVAQSGYRGQVLKRFLAGGLDAVPRRTAPGRARTITSAWEAELLRVIELDRHEVGQDTTNWTTERLAQYLGQQTGIVVTERRCASIYMPMTMSANAPPGRCGAKPQRKRITWETPAGRGSVSRYHSPRTATRA